MVGAFQNLSGGYRMSIPCRECDGACCRVFLLPKQMFNYRNLWFDFIHGAWIKHKWKRIRMLKHLYCLFFYFVFTKRIKDPDIVSRITDGQYDRTHHGGPRRCRLFVGVGCWLYFMRPEFCSLYDCHGQVQIWHEVARNRGLCIPERIETIYSKRGIVNEKS